MPTVDFIIKSGLVVSILVLAGLVILSTAQYYQDVHFSLCGKNFPSNVSFNLEEIGGDENTSLYCVTTFTKCCRREDTGRNYSSGSWRFPNRTAVPSRVGKTAGIVRTRGLNSVILHRLSNESSPTGLYTCEIPDGAGNMTKLFAHLLFKRMPVTPTQSSALEDSCRIDTTTEHTTRGLMLSKSSSSIITIVAVVVVVSIIIIIVTSLLIIYLSHFRKLCFKKEEKHLAIGCTNSILSADTIADTTSFNKEQSSIPVYSVVHTKKKTSNQKSCEDDVEKNGKKVVQHSTVVCNKEELNKCEVVQDVSDLYAAVDKSAKKKKLPVEKTAVQYSSTVHNREESNNKSEVQDASDLYAAVDKSAKKYSRGVSIASYK